MSHNKDEHMRFDISGIDDTNNSISELVREIIFSTFKFSYAILKDIATPDIQFQFRYKFSEKIIRYLPTYVRIRLLREDRLLLRRQIVNYVSRD